MRIDGNAGTAAGSRMVRTLLSWPVASHTGGMRRCGGGRELCRDGWGNDMEPRMVRERYLNRHQAGRLLSGQLDAYRKRSRCMVLGFCPGGIPVAAEVARLLEAPLDAVLVRQTGRFVFTALAGTLDVARNGNSTAGEAIGQDEASAAAHSGEGIEVARRQQGYRGGRLPANLFGRCVILVDDGATDGAALKAAASAVRLSNPSRIVVATPVAWIESLEQLAGTVHDIVCPWVLSVPAPADRAYEYFETVSDAQATGRLALCHGGIS